MEQKIELKPCPFCGSIPQIVAYTLNEETRYSVKCINHNCDVVPQTFMWGSKQHAADAWNRRADNG